MNILVCMKAVPSTGQVQVDGQFKLQRDGAKLQWNIADESALEAALQIKKPDDHITVISMGPMKLQEPMRELLARGADQAILISDSAFAGSDTVATARTLCAAIKQNELFDLILCGRRAIDGETGQVPGMIAAELGIPCITNAQKVQITDENLSIHRRLESGISELTLPLPACVSLCEYTYSLRLPGIMGMRRAKDKSVTVLGLSEIGLDPNACGLIGSLTRVTESSNKFPGLRNGDKEKNLDAGATTLLKMLREVNG